MRTLYWECRMGAAGDMLAASLLDLLPDPSGPIALLNSAGLDGVRFDTAPSVKSGIAGTSFLVLVHGEDESSVGHTHPHSPHRGLREILDQISRLTLPEKVKADASSVYQLLADAESHVHGIPVSEIHFHEIGMLDAIADIVSVCLLLDQISPDRILASAVHVGSGQVHTAHGILPVPAPATAYLLRDIPMYSRDIRGELCTPTGAALLRYFVRDFGDMPPIRASAVGYGMGKKDFEAVNCVRAILGDAADEAIEEIVELCCNLDDMTPEAVAFSCEEIFRAGALDVFTTPIGMKKNRPGILLSCLGEKSRRDDLVRAIFRTTTTLGIREYTPARHVLSRSESTINTEWGPVRNKTVEGYGVRRSKPEYEDVARIAREHNISLPEAQERIRQSADGSQIQ